jgi:cytochrome c oxidase subunit I
MATRTITEGISVARRRRLSETYIGEWLMTTDHKKLGIMYIVTAFFFFLVGGVDALLIRTQLAEPNGKVLTPEIYNQIFTMHGTTMIFLFVMPMLTGFGNYVVPLMIGARDMAFPRMNAFGFWVVLFGGLFLTSSFLFGAAPNAGWFSYAPLTELNAGCGTSGVVTCTPGLNTDFWALGILMLGISSIASALNFVVTILRLRAPGMTVNRMPLFTWMTLITNFLLLFAIPSVTAASILLLLDRHLGTHFFQAGFGGDPLLWQHLFWSFGHPEVYILILPAFGMISEILPVFSRKPIFGYTFIAWSGVAIGFLSFTVWAHHMFAVGLPLVAQAFFATSTTLIAIPTAVKIFNWVATVTGGKISFKPAMLFALGFVAMFLIGGLNGAALAVVPFDYQVTDTYFVVSHLHYVLFGGTVFGVFAGIYYWFPKMTGKLLNDRLGQLQFWLMLIGVNLTFFPMHILGILGMPRRIYTYPGNLGWNELNLLATIGAFIIAAAILVFIWNFVITLRSGQPSGPDPWDAFTLEWDTDSPPKPYNFAVIPVVRSRRPFFDKKNPEIADWKTATH